MMQHEGHVRILKSLKLFGMAHAIEELGNQNSPAFNQALPMLDSLIRGARRIRKKSYAKVFRASVRAETSRLPVCGSAARRNRRLG